MLTIRMFKVVTLLFFASIKILVSGSEQISNERLNPPLEELVNSASSLDWIARLFQQEALFYSKLQSNYSHTLVKLDACDAHENFKKCITETANGLFSLVMKSNSMADKIKALRAMDPFLNDETAKYLIEKCLNNLQDLSSTTQSLTVDGIKTVDKNSDSARTLLGVKYNRDLTNLPPIDSNIWFLINQQAFYSDPLKGLDENADQVIGGIIKHQVPLRADIDLASLFKRMEADESYYEFDVIFQWYRHFVEKSPFKDAQLYDIRTSWELVGRSLSLEDPKLVTSILDAALLLDNESSYNYLLLLRNEDLAKQLKKLDPSNLDEMYSCFVLGLNVRYFQNFNGIFHKITKEKHAELASYFAELQKKSDSPYGLVTMQQRLSYLEASSLFGNNDTAFNMDYARKITLNPKTLELLNVIGHTAIDPIKMCFLKFFNKYLLEGSNWDEAVEKHFHYTISDIILRNYKVLAGNLESYFGIRMNANDQETLLTMSKCRSDHVDCTLDRIPRHLNNFFEIISTTTQQETSTAKRFEIAILGSIFNDETVGIDYKRYFVHHILKGEIDGQFIGKLVLVDVARIHYKNKDRSINVIKAFLYFESLVRNCFPSLLLVDLEKSFEHLLAKNDFSIALENFLVNNFEFYELPLALKGLQALEKELFKYNPGIAIWVQLKKYQPRHC